MIYIGVLLLDDVKATKASGVRMRQSYLIP